MRQLEIRVIEKRRKYTSFPTDKRSYGKPFYEKLVLSLCPCIITNKLELTSLKTAHPKNKLTTTGGKTLSATFK